HGQRKDPPDHQRALPSNLVALVCSAARGRRQLLPLVVFHARALALEEPNRRGGQPGDGREQEELLDLPALLGAALVSHGVPPQGVVEGVGGAGWTRTIDLILIRDAL